MAITFKDKLLFTARRYFNRTIGRNILGWDCYGPTLFGISFISKKKVEAMFSKEADRNLKRGLSTSEYINLRNTIDSIRILPRPALPNYTFSEIQKTEHAIVSVGGIAYAYIRRNS